MQLFSGGTITQFSIFALGIMPYITASIVIQVLTVAVPKLEEWQNQGAVGQRKLTQWTRYITLAISTVQGISLTYMLHSGGGGFFAQGVQGVDMFGPGNFTLGRILLCSLTLTAGATLLMWMGETITQRGVGNGMSLIIFVAVASRVPVEFGDGQGREGLVDHGARLLVFTLMMVAIVYFEQGQRRIPVQFAKRVVGRRMYGGQSTYIPLKVNSSGVIAIIFASALLYLPVIVTGMLPVKSTTVNGTTGDGPQLVVQRAELHHELPDPADEPGVPGRVRPADPAVLVLLQLDPVQRADAGGQHPEAGRVHPRHPARPPDREVPHQGPQPHHAPRRRLHGVHRARSPPTSSRSSCPVAVASRWRSSGSRC